MKQRTRQIEMPAALLALAVVVSLGSMADASAAAATVCPRGGTLAIRNEADREAVATLINCLTDAARRFQGQRHAALAPRPVNPSLDLVRLPASLAPERFQVPGLTPVDPRLADLPPPAC